ncbi:MAG: citryl-CoA lyase [Vulcanimicrobiaceae bacterium]
MPTKTPQELLDDASAWWSTGIVDIHPGKIAMRGYPIEEPIGRVRFPEMIWLMLRGELPQRAQADLLEAALVASVDHGPHAPSAAIARMALTCGLPVNAALALATNVLDDIHGGPAQPCMEFYREIDAAAGENADLVKVAGAVIRRHVDAGDKIVPGFGHRFHPRDPRTVRLLELLHAAQAAGVVSGHWIGIGCAVETALSEYKKRVVPMNIDGVQAIVFCELGFAPELGRGLFILSRTVGLVSHAWEQKQQGGRIKGPMPTNIPHRHTDPARRAVPRRQPEDET